MDNDFTRAGFFIRLLAYLLDSIIVVPLIFLLAYSGIRFPFIDEIFVIIFFTLCNVVFGGTPGKLILRLRVVTIDGEDLGLFASLVREIAKVVLAYFLLINFVWLLLGQKKLALHDIIAKVQVIYPSKSPGYNPDDFEEEVIDG